MGWERRGAGMYLYRKRRVDGRVVSEYVGARSGFLGEAWEVIEAGRLRINADEQQLRTLRRQQERDRMEALEAPVREGYDQVEQITRVILEAAGYHRHDRGPWRKRRMTTTVDNLPVPSAEAPIALIRQARGDLDRLAEEVWLAYWPSRSRWT